jgi:hypothetical protein
VKTSSFPSSVAEVMNSVGVWWAVAGGWAIDLWSGEQTREHHDVEVIVRRCDQAVVHARLVRRRELYCLDPPGSGWRPWNGVPIEPPAFQLGARSSTYEFDIFAETTEQEVWFFRRDARITRPVSAVTMHNATGIPIVRPEVQLLYMAKAMEDKNLRDFETARPELGDDDAHWLADALSVTLPDHPWIRALR